MIQQALTAVQNRIMELSPAHIRCVAEDWGQLDHYTQQPPVEFPCVLLNIEEALFSDLTHREQRAAIVLNVRVTDIASAPAAAPATPFGLLGLAQRIYTHLQGFSDGSFSPLTRISLRPGRRDDGIREYVLRFRLGGTDDTARERLTPIDPVPVRVDPVEVVRR